LSELVSRQRQESLLRIIVTRTVLIVGFISALAVTLVGASGHGAFGMYSLFPADRGSDWMSGWNEKKLSSRASRYVPVDENGSQVLMGYSHDAASALYRRMIMPLSENMYLSWRWKVSRALPENPMEREKAGDDYAARILVSFSPDLFSKQSRALCYVWASREAVGSVYESPYSDNVATIVIQSGSERLGEWAGETRDIVEDYRRAFGSRPETLYGVAVMVDTDNTGFRATAWFSDIVLHQ
jgi:hypothetical protein